MVLREQATLIVSEEDQQRRYCIFFVKPLNKWKMSTPNPSS